MTKTKTVEPDINHGLPPWQWQDPEQIEPVQTYLVLLHPYRPRTPFDQLTPEMQKQHEPKLARWRQGCREAFDEKQAREARHKEMERLRWMAGELGTPLGYERLEKRLEAIEARLDKLEGN